MSRRERLIMLGVAAVIAVVAIVIAVSSGGSSGKSSQASASRPAVIRVVNGKPAGGVRALSYHSGDRIELTVRSDTADEIHIHGYDLHKDVEKGGSVHFSFPATLEGEFVIELENAKQQLAALRVAP